mgnify:CR=1 FL=1
MKLKCKTCKFYDIEQKYCRNFRQTIKVKKSCFAYVEKIINEISEYDIDDIAKKVIEEPEKWTKIRPMKRI